MKKEYQSGWTHHKEKGVIFCYCVATKKEMIMFYLLMAMSEHILYAEYCYELDK